MNTKLTIQFDERRERIRQGTHFLDLPPLEQALLRYFIQNPDARLTKSMIVDNVWPPDIVREGVSDDALYRLISSTRARLAKNAPNASYIVTWRGYPEGGYYFSSDTAKLNDQLQPRHLEQLDTHDLNQLALRDFTQQVQKLAEQLLLSHSDWD